MYQASDVLNCLAAYGDLEDVSENDLLTCCERGLSWVNSRLKEGVSEDEPLILHTAAAIAHYWCIVMKTTDVDKMESYTAGDMTVRRNLSKEIQYETGVKDEAIAQASSILEDGGFYFGSN